MLFKKRLVMSVGLVLHVVSKLMRWTGFGYPRQLGVLYVGGADFTSISGTALNMLGN